MDKTMCGILDIKENTFMKRKSLTFPILISAFLYISESAQVKYSYNPIIYADVQDMSMIRTDNTYYMSSTTMHMSPGVPIIKSKDLLISPIVN